ncbi:hypothetical protein PsAD2_02041 [Pseudovibrio axinellae]|uniref:Uncharacterized protein n=1 Tax=Pseudovibrio axinellae TaxID=989403 RepID=A0A165YW68_9HYPH|nr:hypothetical protein [Pseudovibrio axinellae]KZL19290.1 hypothetical protein PsAD2_02041 [Pseudovibrio axinellae]SEQ42677.1 hypothetical protein SAMN05421798_102666 [Pseudovibrio axinellae]
MKIKYDCKSMAVAIVIALSAMPVQSAVASSDHELNFTFGGRGRNPGVTTIYNYILGCLPNGTWIYGGNPADAAGPWTVEVPAIRNREYSNADVEHTLMGAGCAGVRPAKVVGVDVEDD